MKEQAVFVLCGLVTGAHKKKRRNEYKTMLVKPTLRRKGVK